MNNCILLRYGEIGLKARGTRAQFEKLYVRSIKESLTKNEINDFTIDNLSGRYVVYCNRTEDAIQILSRVPGIQSLSPAEMFKFKSREELIENIRNIALPLVKGKTFCIRANRIGSHEFSSVEMEKEAGSALYEESGGVNLRNPEVAVNLEIRADECFIYTKSVDGVGGLPVGSSGKVLCLFSGGIDSPVAAFQMIKRGCYVDFMFFNPVGEKLFNDVAKIYNFLISNYNYNYVPTFYVVDGKELTAKLQKEVQDRFRQLALKIMLYNVGEKIAKENGHLAIVTGEAISQKSSQTLQSLMFIQNQSSIPVLRPLLSLDKIEITNIARNIGTFISSEKIKEFCNLSTGPVSTSPKEKDVENIPLFKEELEFAVKNLKKYHGVVKLEEEPVSEIDYSNIMTVDIRSEAVQNLVPVKADLSIPFVEVLDRMDEFKKGKSYLFVCEFGVRSENVAFELRKKGIKAAGISVPSYVKYFMKKEIIS